MNLCYNNLYKYKVLIHIRKDIILNGIERRKKIIDALQTDGIVNIIEMSEELKVSSMTIRRDLNKLAEDGLVSLEHGGAILNSGSLFEFNIPFKQKENIEEKRKIARKSLDYVNSGDSIFLDAGTTVKEIAHLLINNKNITVLTHSLLVANELINAKGIKIVMCPGEFRETSMAFMGPLTDEFISQFKIDTLFLAIEGININDGVSVPDILDGVTKRTLVENSQKIICVVDSSKFDKSFFYKICSLKKIHAIITDEFLDDETYFKYKELNYPIIRVPK